MMRQERECSDMDELFIPGEEIEGNVKIGCARLRTIIDSSIDCLAYDCTPYHQKKYNASGTYLMLWNRLFKDI